MLSGNFNLNQEHFHYESFCFLPRVDQEDKTDEVKDRIKYGETENNHENTAFVSNENNGKDVIGTLLYS